MIISISDAVTQTWVVIGALVVLLLISIRKKPKEFFPKSTTDELKGLAILLVVLSHIGYFLVNDHRFLLPLSNYAGVGVDLFLLLSGYGLTMSALQKPLSRLQFYKKRLIRLYIPVAVIIIFFLILDALILKRTYPLVLSIKNFLGFFPSADLYNDIDSPLWFITLLLSYYVIFPLIFWRRAPLVSAGIIGYVSWWLANKNLSDLLPVTHGIASLYQLHLLTFPIGVAIAAVVFHTLQRNMETKWKNLVRTWILVGLTVFLLHMLSRSAVGGDWKQEEIVSIATALAFMSVFILNSFEFGLLSFFGKYSFEIYLIHWPLLYRYDLVYSHLPAGIATLSYLLLFIFLGYWYQKIIARLLVISK